MENLELNYDDSYAVRNYVINELVPQINEDLKDYDSDEDSQYEALYEIINDLSDVIYNYQSRKVSEAFDISPFECSDITGDRYTSYNEMAFDVIMSEFNNQ
jgi:C-terminal processing protease CtpA/Prc